MGYEEIWEGLFIAKDDLYFIDPERLFKVLRKDLSE